MARPALDLEQVIERTMATLPSLISRPKLTPELLRKPPLRFLHDIVRELMKATGFGHGLFTEEDMDPTRVKSWDKDKKVAFFTKLIEAVSTTLNCNVPTRAVKVVAGQEPEFTNILLQLLARAAMTPDANARVTAKHVEEASPPPAKNPPVVPPPAQVEDTTPPQPPDRPVVRPESRKERVQEEGDGRQSQQSQQSQPSPQPPPSQPQPSRPPSQVASQAMRGSPPARAKPGARPARRERETDAKRKRRPPAAESPSVPPAAAEQPPRVERRMASPPAAPLLVDEDPEIAKPQEASESLSDERRRDAPDSPLRTLPSRPKTALKAPPRLATKEMNNQGTLYGEVGKAARRVILEDTAPGDAADDDDGTIEDTTIEETIGVEPENERTVDLTEDADKHGKLLRGILEAERKVHQGGETRAGVQVDPSIQEANAGIDELRQSLQALCQCTNPLGKCMDYVHEDMDGMTKELEEWRNLGQKHREALDEKIRETDHTLQPLYAQLADTEQAIRDQMMKINAMKANILKNDIQVQNLLRLGIYSGGGR